MIVQGILQILVGVFGVVAGCIAFGDIGIACLISGILGIISGICTFITSKRIHKLERELRYGNSKNI